MLDSFGARLRQRREEREIDLIAISEQTKIKLSLLEALERDDVSHWPSGIFRRAFIRAYAHAIGLDPDVVVREFLEVYPEPVEEVAAAAALLAAESGRTGAGPHTRLRYIVGSAIGSLSRLRRGPSTEAPAVAEYVRVNVPAPSVLDLPVPALRSAETVGVDGLNEGIVDCAPVSAAQASETDTHAGARISMALDRVDETNASVAEPRSVSEPASFEPDVVAAAHLCTELGRVENTGDAQPLLQEAARVLDATGLIVWVWDPVATELMPALAHGYSDKVLAQLPTVRRDADNATAAAFRSAQTCAITGSDRENGALVVPLLTPAGCAGVLALELQRGGEQTTSVRAIATIFAAQLAQMVGAARTAPVRPPAEVILPPQGNFTAPMRRASARR